MALQMVGTIFGVFRIFYQKFCDSSLLCRKNDPERMSGSSQTYSFNSIYTIERLLG